MTFLLMFYSPALYRTWFYIIYAYKHRNDVKKAVTSSYLGVSQDLIKNQEFDENRFKKEVKK